MKKDLEVDCRTRDGKLYRVGVDEKELPPYEDMLGLLQIASAPTEKWLEVAFAYRKRQQSEAFVRLLQSHIDTKSKTSEERVRNQPLIIYLLNVLAAHYLSSFLSEGDLSKKEALQEKIYSEINRADAYRMDESMTILKKGFFMFASAKLSTARRYFDNALEMDSRNVVALFGKACVAFSQGEHRDALKMFQHIFKLHPATHLNVRLAIALCFYKLGDFQRAEKALERCLVLNPRDDVCLTYLGVLKLREGQEQIPRGLELLQRAYTLNPQQPLCLLHLANHYFYTMEISKAETLARRALAALDCYRLIKTSQQAQPVEEKAGQFGVDTHNLRSELCFLLAKAAHVRENYAQAHKLYNEALEENKQNHAARYCLGQVLLQSKQYAEAEGHFKQLAEIPHFEHDPDLMKLLAYSQVRLSKKKEAIAKYEQVVSSQHGDLETLVELAQLIESESPKKALGHYETALGLLRQTQASDLLAAEVEMRNNIGVVKSRIGRHEAAKEEFKRAIKILGEEHKHSHGTRTYALNVTVHYNLAFTYEKLGAFAEATELYKRILKDLPQYVDAYLRLSALAFQRGNVARAIGYAEAAVRCSAKQKSHLGECYLAGLYTRLHEYEKADEIFTSILSLTNRHDIYALVGSATLRLLAAQKRERCDQARVRTALADFAAALEHDEKNGYAAVGVAACLALLDRPSDGLQICRLLAESASELEPVLRTLARLYLREGKREEAIPVFRKCLERSGRDDGLELELASAYYQEQMHDSALGHLKRLMVRSPANPLYRYDAGLCIEAAVKQVLAKKMRRVFETQEAIRKIRIAVQLFEGAKKHESPGSLAPHGQLQVAAKQELSRTLSEFSKKADEHLFYCEDILKTSRSYLEHDQRTEQELLLVRQEQDRKRQLLANISPEDRPAYSLSTEEEKEIERRIAALTAGLKEDIEPTVRTHSRRTKKTTSDNGQAKKKRRKTKRKVSDPDIARVLSESDPQDNQGTPQAEGEQESDNQANAEEAIPPIPTTTLPDAAVAVPQEGGETEHAQKSQQPMELETREAPEVPTQPLIGAEKEEVGIQPGPEAQPTCDDNPVEQSPKAEGTQAEDSGITKPVHARAKGKRLHKAMASSKHKDYGETDTKLAKQDA